MSQPVIITPPRPQLSHPDCRRPLIQIAAIHKCRPAMNSRWPSGNKQLTRCSEKCCGPMCWCRLGPWLQIRPFLPSPPATAATQFLACSMLSCISAAIAGGGVFRKASAANSGRYVIRAPLNRMSSERDPGVGFLFRCYSHPKRMPLKGRESRKKGAISDRDYREGLTPALARSLAAFSGPGGTAPRR